MMERSWYAFSMRSDAKVNVTSSTAERKSRCYVLEKKGKLYLKHNVFTKDIPICIAFRCMGIESDQEIMALVSGRCRE